MNIRHLGFSLSAIGIVLFVGLLGLYFFREEAKPVDTKALLHEISQSDEKPQKYYFPNNRYLESLNEGLWGFERIYRRNNRIVSGKYSQLCQTKGAIAQQVHFWLNAPYLFLEKNPNENFVTVRASQVSANKIVHHFALESLQATKSGLRFKRHEVQIIWMQKEDQHELYIRQAYASFGAYHPQSPIVWLTQIRKDLNDKPLIDRKNYNEQKLIAFKMEACNN